MLPLPSVVFGITKLGVWLISGIISLECVGYKHLVSVPFIILETTGDLKSFCLFVSIKFLFENIS